MPIFCRFRHTYDLKFEILLWRPALSCMCVRTRSAHSQNSDVCYDIFEWGNEQEDLRDRGGLNKVLPEGPRIGRRIYKAEDVHKILSQCMRSSRVAAKENKVFLFFDMNSLVSSSFCANKKRYITQWHKIFIDITSRLRYFCNSIIFINRPKRFVSDQIIIV